MMSREPDSAYWDTSIGQVGAHVEEQRVTFQGKRYSLEDASELAEALADAIDWFNGHNVVDATIDPNWSPEDGRVNATDSNDQDGYRSVVRDGRNGCPVGILPGGLAMVCDRVTASQPHRHHVFGRLANGPLQEWAWSDQNQNAVAVSVGPA